MNEFYNRLRQERKRLGLSQEKFATLGGVTRDTQMNYENGSRKPDSSYLEAIALAGVDVLYLLTNTPSNAPLTDEEKELLSGYRALDIRGKANMLGMLDVVGATPKEKPATVVRHNIGSVQFHGNVGDVTHGDQQKAGDLKIIVGGKKKKKIPED